MREHDLLNHNAQLSRAYTELVNSETESGRENYSNAWVADTRNAAFASVAAFQENSYDARIAAELAVKEAKAKFDDMRETQKQQNAAIVNATGEETTILDIAGKTDDGIIVNLRDGTQAIISDSENEIGNFPTVTLNDAKTALLIHLASDYRTSLTMNTFIENARTAEDLESYTRDFNAAYMQGIQGKRFNTARFTITDEQARAAYVAGRGDADALIDSSPTDMTFVEWKKKSAKTNKNAENAFTNEKNDDIMNMKISDGAVVNPMPRQKYASMRTALERQGVTVIAATEGDDLRFLFWSRGNI